MKAVIYVFLAVIGALLAVSAVSAQANLFQNYNPSFEDGGAGGATFWTAGWYGQVSAVSTEQAHSGARSWKLAGAGSHMLDFETALPVDTSGATRYRFKVWIKAPTFTTDRVLWLRMRWGDFNLTDIYGTIVGNTTGWQLVDFGTVTPTPAQTLTNFITIRYTAAPPTGPQADMVASDYFYMDDIQMIAESTGPPVLGSFTGKVTYNGAPVAGALVGAKSGTSATADAAAYTYTDADGNYTISLADGSYRVAAWYPGYTPSDDSDVVAITHGLHVTRNLVLPTPDGLEYTRSLTDTKVYASANSATRMGAFDGSPRGGWGGGTGGTDAYLTMDIGDASGNPRTIGAFSIYHGDTALKNYVVEVTDQAPLDGSGNPIDGLVWTTIYSANALGGYKVPFDYYWEEAAKITPVQARGVRVHIIQGAGIAEFTVYSATEFYSAVAPNLTALKSQAADALVKMNGYASVIYAPRSSSNARTTSFFYIGEKQGISGLKVVDKTADNLTLGNTVTGLSGRMRKPAGAEPYFELMFDPAGSGNTQIRTCGTNNKSAATDPKAKATAVTVWGKVSGFNGTTFRVDDGYAKPITVNTNGIPTTNLADGTTAIVTGVIGQDGIVQAQTVTVQLNNQ